MKLKIMENASKRVRGAARLRRQAVDEIAAVKHVVAFDTKQGVARQNGTVRERAQIGGAARRDLWPAATTVASKARRLGSA
jgi:hypothetical protein